MSAHCKRLEYCMLLKMRLPCSDVMKLVHRACKHTHMLDVGWAWSSVRKYYRCNYNILHFGLAIKYTRYDVHRAKLYSAEGVGDNSRLTSMGFIRITSLLPNCRTA
jgi:hypothetical protein